MKKSLLALWFPLASMAVASCGGGDGDGDGDRRDGAECQRCRTTAPQCDTGMTCQKFTYGAAALSLCAKPTTSSCPQPPP